MSRLPFELQLALRYLRPKRTFVSVITLISIIGVMLGVAVLIIVISVMSGFDRQLRDRIIGFNGHLKIHPPQSVLRDYQTVMTAVEQHPRVRGVTPYVFGQVLVETQPEGADPQWQAQWVRGIDPAREGAVTQLANSVRLGRYDVRGNGLLVGVESASLLGLGIGDPLAIYSPGDLRRMKDSQTRGEAEAILPTDYVVQGVFDVGYYEYNASVIVCSLANAQDLYGLDDGVHGLVVRLDDPYQANRVRADLEATLGPGLRIRTWEEDNASILEALIVEKNVMFYLLFFITIVAAFGITSALITFVVQKTREIGVLKALGASSGQIMRLFLVQSLVVGVLGVSAGYSLGRLAVAYRNEFLRFMRQATGWELFPAAIYNFRELPALVVPSDLIVICGGSLLICLLAGLIPAWNAGRLKPVEALRHE